MSEPNPILSLLESLACKYKPAEAGFYEGVIHIYLTDDQVYSFTLRLTGEGCNITEGTSGIPDCEIRTSIHTLQRIVNNERSPHQEFIMGNIYISNIQVIQHIGKAFR
jgi:hypothetical protein